MKTEKIDWSKAIRGRIVIKPEQLNIPIYLDKDLRKFYFGKAKELNVDPAHYVKSILRKQMELIHEYEKPKRNKRKVVV